MTRPSTDDPNVRWAKALAHPLRVQILEQLVADRLASATPLAELLGVEHGIVSYHLRRLEGLGFVALDSRTPARGFKTHHYRLTDREATVRALEHAEDLARLAAPAGARSNAKTTRGLVSLGGALRAAREAQDVSVGALARRAGTTPATLERIEQGDSDPQMALVTQLAEAMGLTLLDVVRRMR